MAGAAASQTAREPTATILVVPYSKAGPHTQLVDTPYMMRLARVPQQAPASALTAGVGTDSPTAGYKGGLDIFVVANETAVQGLNARSMRALLSDLEAAGATGQPKKRLHAREDDTPAVRPYPNKEAHKLRSMTNSPPPAMKPTNSVKVAEPVALQQTLEELYPARRPIRLIAEQIIWTDGSCIKPEDGDGPNRLGAAVYKSRRRSYRGCARGDRRRLTRDRRQRTVR